MRRFQLGLFMGFFSVLAFGTGAGPDHSERLRADCRFYGGGNLFCYSSIVYRVEDNALFDIRYGVGCDRQTLYNDGGTPFAQETVSDGIRPRTAATPKVEVIPQNSLRHPGTFTAKLEIEAGKLTDGVCYVTDVSNERNPYESAFFDF